MLLVLLAISKRGIFCQKLFKVIKTKLLKAPYNPASKKKIAVIPPHIYDRLRPGMQQDILLVSVKMEKNPPP